MKTYKETVEWMFQQLPIYQKLGNPAFKKDLSNIHKLAAKLGNPQGNFKSIHVAGTNGKGSVSHMLAAVLQASGYKVGLYTSPHLKDFRERIRIGGKKIPREAVVRFFSDHDSFFRQEQLSFFEMSVGMAFDFFSQEKVDIAVIEVGLGGRLDSTNIISPEISVITNIGLDHTAILGTSRPEIAGEKAGIIKRNTPVVIGETDAEILAVFEEKARQMEAPLFLAEKRVGKLPVTDLLGSYQRKNIRCVLQVIDLMQKKSWKIPVGAVETGLSNVVRLTGLRGRWEIIRSHPKVIADTAHNREGLELTMKQLKQEIPGEIHLVMGVVKDKDLGAILPIFPREARYYFCKPDIPRGMEARALQEAAQRYGMKGSIYDSVRGAYLAALGAASEEDVIYVGGSTFVVAEVL